MSKIVIDWLWRKRWFLFIGPIMAGITGFIVVILNIDLPAWLFFSIIIISVPLGITSVIIGWIHFIGGTKRDR